VSRSTAAVLGVGGAKEEKEERERDRWLDGRREGVGGEE